ncbi:MAG: DUF4347 domain-containing protein, partial [Desulfobacterales bacterium]|nr:DUF4347 domain-containing protein [Desulfobacterales bacterium]
MAKRRARKQPRILRYEELEQRVLFSADGVPGLDIDGGHEQVMTEDFAMGVQADPKAPEQTVEQNDETADWELVFIDENVTDYEQLIVDMEESPGNRIIEVVVIDSHHDGIEQVSKALAERSELTAVHFITHGTDGQINLGDAWLNSTSLEQNRDAVAQWGNALTATGDVLFYGCNIAANTDGQSLLDRISRLTGADVAASDDMTGNSDQGGDWDLEYLSGIVETKISVRSDQQHGWSHLLAPPTITSNGGGDTTDINVAENTTAVTTVTATDTPAYSISGGADQGKFTIHGVTGVLTFNAPPDFEAPGDADGDNVYNVTVMASDGGDDTQDISVHVTNVNETPVNTAPEARSLEQNGMLFFSSSIGTAVSISDPDAGTNPVQVTLTAVNGTLNLPGTKGLTFAFGDGTADATMIFTGSIDDINAAMEGMTFVVTPGFTGIASIQITTNDQQQTGSGFPLSDSDVITIIVNPEAADGLWLSTDSGATVGLAFGDLTWTDGEVVQFADPNFALSQGENAPNTNGTFTSIVDFDAAGFAQDNDANINGLHYVTRDLIINNGDGSVQLLAGDLLFSTKTDEVFGGLTVTNKDIAMFCPDTPGDYSSGSFSIVLDDPTTGTAIRGVALVQKEITVGSVTPVTLTPGDFLFTLEGDSSIWRYEPDPLAGTLTEFIQGNSVDVGISHPLNSIHLVEKEITFGGIVLKEGEILATMNADDIDLGKNHIAVEKYDVFRLSMESTGVGTSAAQASLLLDGGDVEMGANGEEFDGLTLLWDKQALIINDDAFNLNENTSNGTLVRTVPNNAVEPSDTLSYAIIAGNIDNGFKISRTSGEITVANSAALDFETTPIFTLTIAAIEDQGVYDTATITINITQVNNPPVIIPPVIIPPVIIPPVNNPPMAANARFNTFEDTVYNGTLPMATDPDGDPVTYTLENSPENGTAVVNANGSFSYTPNADFNGIDTFTYTVEDGNGG